MARPINRLTARTVTTAGPGRHADGNGLFLFNDGTKRWVFHFHWAGQRREMGLGSAAEVSLAEARRARDEARELVRRGLNPIEERRKSKAARTGKTLGDVAKEMMADKGSAWLDSKASAPWRRTWEALSDGSPYAEAVRHLRPQEVDTAAVLRAIKPLWLTKPETAGKVRGHIEATIDAATAQGLRVGDNPARWRGHLDKLLPRRAELTRGHQRAISYKDLPAVWMRLRAMKGAAAKALAFTILTVSRESQTLLADAEEFNLAAKLWTVPKARMKGRADQKREHEVPLTDTAITILHECGFGRGIVFKSPMKNGALSNSAMDKVCDTLKIDATPHGFRSTFRDWAGDCTDFPEEIAEAALAHVVGSKTRRAYRRKDALDKRRRLLEAWEQFVTSAITPRPEPQAPA